MKVQKFRARTFAEGLRQIKETLGDDAVILESKVLAPTLKKIDVDEAQANRRHWKWLGLGRDKALSEDGELEVAADDEPQLNEVEITAAVGQDAEALVEEVREATLPLPPLPKAKKVVANPVEPLVKKAPSAPTTALERFLQPLRAQLLQEEVAQEVLDDLMFAVATELGTRVGDVGNQALEICVSELMARIPLFNHEQPSENKPKIVALVGTSGVGKTITAAKLAATSALSRKQRLAIVALGSDGSRDEALRRVSKVLSCPLQVCKDGPDLKATLEVLQDLDQVIVDTQPLSPFDREGLMKLEADLSVIPGLEIHLLLSPSHRDSDLRQAIESFSTLGLHALLFTHLDIAACYGGILNASYFSGLPLSHFGFGSQVPGDLEPASRERLIDLLLDLSRLAGET